MNRIIILGCPGSGKSYISKKLAEKTGLPLYHLDNIWLRADGSHITREKFDAWLQEKFQEESWIIEGDYSRTYEVRMKACDMVIFLDYDVEISLQGVMERSKGIRDDSPINMPDDYILQEIKNYRTEKRPVVLSLLDKYSNKEIIILHNREEAEKWLLTL